MFGFRGGTSGQLGIIPLAATSPRPLKCVASTASTLEQTVANSQLRIGGLTPITGVALRPDIL